MNKTLEFFVKTMFYDVMKKKMALNFLKMEFYGCENLGQFFEAIQLPYHLLRSIKEALFPFFQQAARTIGCATKKVLFFLSTMNRNFVPNRNLVKFLFGQSLTIIVDRDLILKIENLPLIFHPGAFAELGIKKALSRG